VATAHNRIRSDFCQDCSYSSPIGIDLYFRPRVCLRSGSYSSVFCLYPNEARIAGGHSLPITLPRVEGPTSRYDKVRAVTPEAKLSEWTGKIGSSFSQDPEARHYSGSWSDSVMAHHTPDASNVSVPTIPPPRLFSYLKASIFQDFRQPS